MKKVYLTGHGKLRSRERVGKRKKAAYREAAAALKNGITHREASGKLKKYLDYLYLSRKKANNIRVYQNKVYLFQGKTLITVLNLPEKFYEVIDKILEKRAQNSAG